MTKLFRDSPTSSILTLTLVLFFAIRLSAFWFSDIPHLVTQFEDDAYYYLKIARNTVDLHRVTFDGRNDTNGFHPLWLMLLLPIFRVCSDPILALRIVGSVSTLLLALGYYVAWRHLIRNHSSVACAFSLVLALYFAHIFSHTNLEVSLAIPLAIMSLVVLTKIDLQDETARSRRSLIALGMLMSCTQLARLDTVFLNLIIFGHLLKKMVGTLNRRAVKGVAIVAIPPLVTGTAYLLLNYWWFGHMIPVSGIVKSITGVGINFVFLRQMLRSPGWLIYTAMVVLALVQVMPLLFRTGYRLEADTDERQAPRIVSCQFLLVFTAYYALRSSWFLWGWYLYPALFVVIFGLPVVVDAIFAGFSHAFPRKAHVAAWLLTLLLLPALATEVLWPIRGLYRNVSYSYLYQNYLVANTLNHRLAGSPLIAMGDRAGSLAYFYHGQVLQLEGIVEGYDVIQAIRDNTLAAYLTANEVRYVVSWFGPALPYSLVTLTIPRTALSQGPHAELSMCRGSEVYRRRFGALNLVVWKWPSCNTDSTP